MLAARDGVALEVDDCFHAFQNISRQQKWCIARNDVCRDGYILNSQLDLPTKASGGRLPVLLQANQLGLEVENHDA